MKKLFKVIMCLALALIVPFGLVGCDKEQLEENTKTVTVQQTNNSQNNISDK